MINSQSIAVEADDNTALLLDHGNTVYSVIQTGFVYAAQRDDWTVQLIGTGGYSPSRWWIIRTSLPLA